MRRPPAFQVMPLVVRGALALALTVGLLVGSDVAVALPDAPASETHLTIPTEAESRESVDLEVRQAQRIAQLRRRSMAVETSVAALEAIEAERLLELGYDPETATTPQEIARQMMLTWYAWGEDEYACYDAIIMRESGWDPTAENPSSGAYGIPQALPATKLASAGDDWKTNPATQLKWGLDYVKQRYGTPCQAWSFKQSNGWY